MKNNFQSNVFITANQFCSNSQRQCLKIMFLLGNLYVSWKINAEILSCWRGIHFCGRYIQLLQLSVIQLCQICFLYSENGKCSHTQQNIAEILRDKHSIFMLLTIIFSCGKNFDQGTF